MYRFTLSTNLKLKNVDILKGRKFSILSKAMYLDTETSHNHNENDLKAWIESICYEFNNEVVILRKPSEFIECLQKIKEYYNLSSQLYLIIYIHNLSYDIQYLKNWLIDRFGKDYEILATSNHKFITFKIDYFIFRCSYKLSNKSLEKWCNDLNTTHKKLVNTIDYNKINYQDTILSKSELKYQYYDVLCLKECVLYQLDNYNDTLLSIPLTSTSYIRREILRNYNKDRQNNRKSFDKQRMTKDIYLLCRFAFSGGYTHGNRFLKAITLNGNIRHRDFVSHYPSVLRVNQYPVGKWFLLCKKKNNLTISELLNYTNEYCLLIEIEITNLTIKKGVTMPFAQYNKFYQGQLEHCKYICDNGRILKMQGTSKIACTELDLQILSEQYTFEYTIINVYASQKGYLPKYLTDTIDKFFHGKTHFKEILNGLKEKDYSDYSIEYIEANTNLMKSKNGINSIYGCCATDIIRPIIEMNINGEWSKQRITDEYIEEQLIKYYKNPKSTLSYAWGTWCTSYARYELYKFIKIIGYHNIIYCDTDSIFYFSNSKIENKIEKMNSINKEKAIEHRAYIKTDKGTVVNYDNFEIEKEKIIKFRFLHSKCYCYIEDNGNEHLIIAGVTPLSKDKKTNRMEELGSIENLKNGFIFEKCGGTLSKYIEEKAHVEIINGHKTEIASSCVILDNTKTLNDIWEEVDIDYIEEWEVDE